MTDISRSAPVTRLVSSTGKNYHYQNSQRSSPDIDDDQDTLTSESGSLSDDSRNSSNSSTTSSPSNPTNIGLDSGIFRNLLWSSDGTSLITASADNTIRSFILPPSLLQPSTNRHLESYSTHPHPSPVYATAISPYYSLSAPETTLILTSPSSLPIRLFSPFAPGILARYPLVNPQTERWIAPHSLAFTAPARATDGSFVADNSLRFLAGSLNQISLFDISRDGDGPMTIFPTAPANRKSRRGGGNGMAGIVSAMAISCDGILAAGTFSRGVGLYDAQGMGDTIGTWNLKDAEEGNGVTNLCWSRCGRYLVVAERGSDGLGVWDIRGTGRRLAWLEGREAMTMQRLGLALGSRWDGTQGEDAYAGGTDGIVRVWYDIGMREGQIKPDWHWQAHEDAVAGIGIHACGSVVATCSGSRKDVSQDGDFSIGLEDPEPVIDNSVRVWSISSENENLPP